MGQEKGEKFMSYLNSASSAEQQRLEGHRSFCRDPAVVEEHRRRMGLKDWHRIVVFRPRLGEYVATMVKKGSHMLIELSFVSTYVRTRKRQRQESEDQQADVLVHSRRRCPQARPVRTGTGKANGFLRFCHLRVKRSTRPFLAVRF
jgi:single-stranded DNA-binding protein